MALKTNTTLLAQLPLRQIGGSPGTFRSMWGRGDRMNQSVGVGIPSKLAGIPSGHLAPSSWVLPYKPGAMSSFTNLVVTVTPGTLNLAAGVNITGSTTVTITVNPADGQLIVSASGSTSITFNLAGNLAGALSASGSTSFSFTVNNATLGAIVDAVGAALVQFSNSATVRATGNLSGDITPFTELSPQSLSAAVWESLASAYNAPGTMGELLNSAGGGASPATIAAEVWSTPLETLTAEEIMRVLLAALAGARSGLGSGTEEYLAQDGTTPRITFSPDAQGNGTPIIDAT
jgi:hypothetical protein